MGPARLIVKPEKSTVYVSPAPTTLKVYFQNNFPYTLFDVKMRGKNPAYTVTVAPAKQTVYPGQNVLFTFTITSAGGSGSILASTLDIQVWIRYELGDNGYRGASDPLVNQSPSQTMLIENRGYLAKDGYQSPGQQSPSLSMATLADLFPTATLPAGAPFFGRTGLQQLIHFFGYRFCYYAEGGWGCGDKNCPSPCAEGSAWTSTLEFGQNAMRAGVDLAVRKSKLGSQLGAARDAAVNSLKGGSEEHKCLTAVVGAVLWQGAASAPFEAALAKASARCKAAGLRSLGKGPASDCSSGAWYEQATCAAAEGLQGNDAPVKSILIPNAGDGLSSKNSPEGWQKSHFYSYMLYLVTGDNYAHNRHPSYYDNVGGLVFPDGGSPPDPDAAPPVLGDNGLPLPGNELGAQPQPDRGTTTGGGSSDTGGCLYGAGAPAVRGGWLVLVALLLLALRSRR